MAQKVRIERYSDLSGDLIPEGEGETVNYAVNGRSFEIDLTAQEASDFHRTLEPFVAVSRRVGKSGDSKKSRSTGDREKLQEIRNWARGEGYEVSERGRISQNILEAYEKAQS